MLCRFIQNLRLPFLHDILHILSNSTPFLLLCGYSRAAIKLVRGVLLLVLKDVRIFLGEVPKVLFFQLFNIFTNIFYFFELAPGLLRSRSFREESFSLCFLMCWSIYLGKEVEIHLGTVASHKRLLHLACVLLHLGL